MAKLTLNDVGSLIDATTAKNTINANSAAIETAMEKTLSRDGTTPNTMSAPLDMNSQHILNLPAPVSANDPIRLQDLSTFSGGGTIATIPTGGTTNQPLSKNSNANYDVKWNTTTGSGSAVLATSPTLVSPTLGTPASGNLVNCTGILVNNVSGINPGAAAWLGTPTSSTMRAAVADASGTGALAFNNSPAFVTPSLGTPASGNLSNCTNIPSSQLTGLGTGVGTFLTTPSSANLATAVTDETGTGALVFANTPTLVTPVLGAATATTINGTQLSRGQYLATGTNDNAAAGFIGEYIEAIVTSGSATALTTSTAKTITSISLTPGDWDVDAIFYMLPANTTSVTQLVGCLSLVTNTLDTTPGRVVSPAHPTIVYNGSVSAACTIPPYRFSLSSTSSIFLIGFAVFTVSTNAGFGIIRARRVR